MQVVIPMAGAGQRFVDAGYQLPKPLIPVGKVPMVVRVVHDLPPAQPPIFVCHPDHVAQHRIDLSLLDHFPNAQVVLTPGLTAGQAATVRLAGDRLNLDEDVLVAACDNTHQYDRDRFLRLTHDPQVDCVVWVYRGDPRVLVRPDWYGWVRGDANGNVLDVSVKRPISPTPLSDFVVSGCFWFRTARMLLDSIDRLLDSGLRVNGEYYLDSVPKLLLQESRHVKLFEVDQYIGWGTPEDLETYLRWQQHFTALAPAA